MRMALEYLMLALLVATLCLGAQSQPGEDMWQSIRDSIDAFADVPATTIFIGSDDQGIVFNYTKGGWEQTQKYIVASASKWVSSTAIWVAIQQGKISVDDRASQYLSWWTTDPADARSNVTLGNLLSFSSGFTGDTCDYTKPNLTQCVKDIYNAGITYSPGTNFYYCGDHHQIAALMVLNAVGLSDWNVFFNQYILSTLGISTTAAVYLPPNCPNVAGGLYTDALTYLRIFQAIYTNINPPLVNTSTRALRERDWNTNSTIAYTPLQLLHQDWHYASSFWVICPFRTYNSTCVGLKQFASPGKYGYLPFIDRIGDYWILLATYRDVTGAFTFSAQLVQEIQPTVANNFAVMRGSVSTPTVGPTAGPAMPSLGENPTAASPSTASSLAISPIALLLVLISVILVLGN